jgi:hypothetical protein
VALYDIVQRCGRNAIEEIDASFAYIIKKRVMKDGHGVLCGVWAEAEEIVEHRECDLI